MAEDDMLINFDVGKEPIVPRIKFKGGRWKDKVSAQKRFQRYHQNAVGKTPEIRNVESEMVTADRDNYASKMEDGRIVKKARVQPPESFDVHRPKPAMKVHDREIGSRGKSIGGVVSSLFSYNPGSKTDTTKRDEEYPANAMEPSNAPLKSELDTFTSLGLTSHLAEHLLHKLEIKAPTAIQRAALTQIMREETDAFIQAETGSGKTLAYLLPIVQRIISLSQYSGETAQVHRDSGLFAIILAPTRELSKQISTVLERLLSCAHWIVSGTVLGGEKKKSEKARLRRGLNILIATPGRLADHVDHTKVLDMSNVRWLVLDEGDRLMELGFEKDIEKILLKLKNASTMNSSKALPGLPHKRTTVLCSATMKSNVSKLGELSLKDAAFIHTTEDELKASTQPETPNLFSAPAQLKQTYSVVPAKLRLVALAALLKREFARRGSVMRAIVFMSCADSVDFHFEVLTRRQSNVSTESKDQYLEHSESDQENVPTPRKEKSKRSSNSLISAYRTILPSSHLSTSSNPKVVIHRLHGSLPQQVRSQTLASFRNSTHPSLLVCTDVASRGLDLPNVDLVIEYDPPFHCDDHLHRVGRTARAGNPGRATIFLLPGPEESYADDVLRQAGLTVDCVEVNDILRRGFGSPGLGAGKDWEDRATDWQLAVERWALESPDILEKARRAFQSHVRAYATHVAVERPMFDMAELHLGHLAKAFGLRDRPGAIRVPGLRPAAGKAKAEKGIKLKGSASSQKSWERGARGDVQAAGGVDLEAGAKKMETKMKEQGAVSEYNLG